MVGQGRHKRIQANVTNKDQQYYEEYDYSTRLNQYHLYEITQVNAEGRTQKDILTNEEYYKPFNTRQLAATGDKYLVVDIILKGIKLKVIVDSGVHRNFISPTIILEYLLPTEVKGEGYYLVLADGELSANRIVDVETIELGIGIAGHQETIRFDVTGIGGHDIILGLLQIEKHNPDVNQTTRQLRFSRCQYYKDKARGLKEVCATFKEEPRYPVEGPLIKDILLIYKKYEAMFEEELGLGALLKYADYDYRIELIEGAKPAFQPLREYSAKDLVKIKQYIDKNLAKGFIRESKSP